MNIQSHSTVPGSQQTQDKVEQLPLSAVRKAEGSWEGHTYRLPAKDSMTRDIPGCIPDRSQLSMRFRSASTQNSLPRALSTTRATGRMRPVVKRTSRSVPSREARSILAAWSCILVKYMYLWEQCLEAPGEEQVLGAPTVPYLQPHPQPLTNYPISHPISSRCLSQLGLELRSQPFVGGIVSLKFMPP